MTRRFIKQLDKSIQLFDFILIHSIFQVILLLSLLATSSLSIPLYPAYENNIGYKGIIGPAYGGYGYPKFTGYNANIGYPGNIGFAEHPGFAENPGYFGYFGHPGYSGYPGPSQGFPLKYDDSYDYDYDHDDGIVPLNYQNTESGYAPNYNVSIDCDCFFFVAPFILDFSFFWP